MIRKAAGQGSEMIVLPECLDLGWTHPGARELAEPIPGKISDLLAKEAKNNHIFVVAGLTEKRDEKIYNSAVVISDEGEIILTHSKINELDFTLDLYTKGNQINTVDTEFGRIGIPICADLLPEGNPIGHSVGLMGADLILSPCSWAVQPDHDNRLQPYGSEWVNSYGELSEKHQMTIVGVTNVGLVEGGEWDGWKCIGCSLAVGPNGEHLARGSYGEDAHELLTFEVEI